MPHIRSRLNRATVAVDVEDADRPVGYVKQHLHPDGVRRLPSDEETDAAAERLEAEGRRVILWHVHYTQHSLDNGHGPDEWAAPTTTAQPQDR